MTNTDDRLIEVLEQLKSGVTLIKCKPNGKKYSRQFFLHDRETFMSYDKSRKIFGKPNLYHIKDIDEVRTGFSSETFDQLMKSGRVKRLDHNRAFSIIYDNHRKGEHFMAPNGTARDLWVKGLLHLKSQYSQKGQHEFMKDKNWVLEFFDAADKDKSKKLSKQECRDLLADSLNIEMPDRVFDKMFSEADKSGRGALDSADFLNFFNALTRRKDLYEIMFKFIKNPSGKTMENICMNRDELRSFLRATMNQNMQNIDSPIELQRLINTYEHNIELRNKGLLSLDGFRNMLLSKSFDIIESLYSQRVYQDMTRPLCDYYINTSHNTYLFYSQLSGDSDPEAYNRVLLLGCRAVEFDCYDGDDGTPIVKHGFTLVKPCSFESIIRLIEPNLFKTSPYPVIFNIENHCSTEQQRQMARILKTILGDKLLTKHLSKNDRFVLPSPENLKYKVLVRSKIASRSKESKTSNGEEYESFSTNVDNELNDLFVYFSNVSYRDFNYAKANYTALNSSSLSEGDFLEEIKDNPIDIIKQTAWRLLRTYPDGFRQDSSNQDPIPCWNFGVQMVALNFQTEDDMNPLNNGKFLDNGGCGYVLKPGYLINAAETMFNPWNPQLNLDRSITLTIQVISGQFLARPKSEGDDISDVYVEISTHGLPCDKYSEKTTVIDNNGFDPRWDEKFTFKIKFPQLCLIYFAIMDSDPVSSDDRIAYFCAPIKMIQRGYRHIHLRANNNDSTYSTLFVHVDIQQDSEVYSDDVNIIRTRL